MKKKAVEQLKPLKTRKKGLVATVQETGDILILNIYENKVFLGRYCMNAKTNEYQNWEAKSGLLGYKKLCNVCGYGYGTGSYVVSRQLVFNSAEERQLAEQKLQFTENTWRNVGDEIDCREMIYQSDRRKTRESNRTKRIVTVMSRIPELPEGIEEWIYHTAVNDTDYVFYDRKREEWQCTCCGKCYGTQGLKRADGEKKIRHNDMVICPKCQKTVQAKKRTNKQEQIVHFMLLQPVSAEMSVARHFDVDIYWHAGKKSIHLDESIRTILYKLSQNPKDACHIYYNQYTLQEWSTHSWFDDNSNRANRRTFSGYLYEEGIEDALKGTAYEAWTVLFRQMAAAGQEVQYNNLMAVGDARHLINVVEYLFKGRFNRLLKETTEGISYYRRYYSSHLHLSGENIEEVFAIADRQKINRIREMDGGEDVLEWMQWSDRTGEKISKDALLWLTQSKLSPRDVSFIDDRMSVQKIMNYVIRQKEECYKEKTAKQIVEQWKDYLSMCGKLKKHMEDEMVYRPRELKRRHDEAVAEIAAREARLEAEEYRRRFPGAEEVLCEVRERFEYENERYRIIVPQQLVDIVAEGRVLHHCAGATDRYFDRIRQRETYICFLRKVSEPELPYYTIEVEPGGTIRQHRGYLDEEPEIEQVKPFLREWQQVLKKRLNDNDRRYAAISAVKREENIEELKAKNNTRVLEGLMEDFMEAI